MKDVFSHCYEHNCWECAESRSGPGSSATGSALVRRHLPDLFNRCGIKVLVDVPCGDFNWMRLALPTLGLDRYIGGDIVERIVTDNNLMHGASDVEFRVVDITRDDLPPGDLLLCRFCLQHLSDAAIHASLANFVRSGIPLILLTSYWQVERNMPIQDGGFYPVNFQAPPWSFPEPLEMVDDWAPGAEHKSALALWTSRQVSLAVKVLL